MHTLLWSSVMCCRANVAANSWTSGTRKHHAQQLLPDLTARSFEDDKITLKCKGDATVSSEPDGSILGLARQELSSGAAAIFFLFFLPPFMLAFFFIIYFLGRAIAVWHRLWFVINEQIFFLMLRLKYWCIWFNKTAQKSRGNLAPHKGPAFWI